jgi:type I restriction enzyme S subunit
MEEWKEYKLGDVLCNKGYIRGPFGSALKRGDLLCEGIPVYEQQHAIYNKRDFRFYISEEKYNEMKRFSVYPDDIIISCSGTVGEVSLIRKEDPKGIISQALLLLRANKNVILPLYLLYFFKTVIGHNAITSRSSGSVQVNIARRAVIEDIPLYLPNLDNQRKIVSVIKSLDDKIEVNRRINDNLEQQAQALFKSWFVDFEPFKDQPFVESELGMIPQGWRVESLSSIADYVNGLAMQKYRPEGGEKGLPVLKIKELGQGNVDDSSESCSPSLIGEKYIINDGDIIFSWSGTLMVKIWCGGKCGLNQHLFVVNPKDYPKWFVYHWTKYHLDNFIRIAKDKAVTMGHIKRGELDKAKTVIPDNENMQKVDALMKPIFDQMIANELESRRLAELRDTLLPKLMSGELKVENVTF